MSWLLQSPVALSQLLAIATMLSSNQYGNTFAFNSYLMLLVSCIITNIIIIIVTEPVSMPLVHLTCYIVFSAIGIFQGVGTICLQMQPPDISLPFEIVTILSGPVETHEQVHSASPRRYGVGP